MTERRRWTYLALGYAAVLLAVFWRVLFRRQVCGWDCLDEYWPDLVFQSRALADGELPLWNPYTLGGYAFYADPQAGVLTPVNWLCTVVSWLFGVGPYLIQLKVLVLFYAALLGMHLLVWRWTRSHVGAAVAALTFVFGAPMLVHKNSALIWPLLLLPWAIVAFDAFRARASLGRGFALGGAVALVIVTHPQGGFYSWLVLATYAGYCAVAAVVAHHAARAQVPVARALLDDARRLAPGLAAAAIVAVAWIATVYVPTWSTVEGSARAQRGLDWVLGDPLPVRALGELFVPAVDTSWMHDIYMGPLGVIGLVWVAIVQRRTALWLAIAIVSVLLALGAAGHLLPWLAQHVPAFGLFRIAYRYKLITGFAFAAGVGLAIGTLATAELTRRQRGLLLALTGCWLAAALAISRALPPWSAVLVVVALCGSVLDAQQRRRWWRLALVALVLLDLWRAADLKLAILQPRPPTDRGGELLAKMPGVARDWRFHASRYSGSGGMLPLPYHASYVHGAREISGFEHPLVPQRMLAVLAASRRAPALLTHFNTKYFVGPAPAGATAITGTPIAVAADVAPAARLYPRAELASERDILARLLQVMPSGLGTALVEPADQPPTLPAEQFAPVDGRVISRERSRLTIEIDAPAAGVLVVNEAWSPLWRATIDGNAAPLFRANYMLRGLVVPRGLHRVELTLAAPFYRGMLLADAALIVLILALVVVRPRLLARRRRAALSTAR